MADLPKTRTGTKDDVTAPAAPSQNPRPENYIQTVQERIDTELKAAQDRWAAEFDALKARQKLEAQNLKEKHAADLSQAEANTALHGQKRVT